MLMSDHHTFLKAFNAEFGDNRKPFVFYGYSLGATFSIGSYVNILKKDRELADRVKAILTVSGQYGMGDFWYPCWYRPRQGRLLSMLNYKYGAFPALVSKRDRHDKLQYKGPTYAKTLWTVHSWTDANLA